MQKTHLSLSPLFKIRATLILLTCYWNSHGSRNVNVPRRLLLHCKEYFEIPAEIFYRKDNAIPYALTVFSCYVLNHSYRKGYRMMYTAVRLRDDIHVMLLGDASTSKSGKNHSM